MRVSTAFVAALLLAAPALQACSQPTPAAGEDRLITPPEDDRALNVAMKKAVETQDIFWAKFDAREPGTSNYGVKLEMIAPDGFHEYIWAEPVSHTPDQVVARIANEPVHLKGVSLGSEVRVKADTLWDWTYQKGGKAYGHFTTRALMSSATPEQRAEVQGLLAPTPLESDAR